jgi:hypothetical protein
MRGTQRSDEHVGQWRHQIGARDHRASIQLPTSEELEIDG